MLIKHNCQLFDKILIALIIHITLTSISIVFKTIISQFRDINLQIYYDYIYF